jgi:hypothetical protein
MASMGMVQPLENKRNKVVYTQYVIHPKTLKIITNNNPDNNNDSDINTDIDSDDDESDNDYNNDSDIEDNNNIKKEKYTKNNNRKRL